MPAARVAEMSASLERAGDDEVSDLQPDRVVGGPEQEAVDDPLEPRERPSSCIRSKNRRMRSSTSRRRLSRTIAP
ncbi:MAG: hypothetical protein AB7I72_27325 [Parvibaculaceae bacterium]